MFRTVLTPRSSLHKISHSDRLLTLGSCFSEMIGRKLADNKFSVLSNPVGILYNPVSQHRLLRFALDMEEIPDLTTGVHGRYLHFDAHSRINGSSPADVIKSLSSEIEGIKNYLPNATWLILTYGTSRVYMRDDRVVANCHKQPGQTFTKRMLTLNEMIADAQPVIEHLFSAYPRLRIILTVSPVRHVRDTLEVNSISKSLLRIFCDEMVKQFDRIDYFPSFELMMDDLRDYRFYGQDMIHPSTTAENYIFEKFSETYFGEKTMNILREWDKLRTALSHKPFNPKSQDHKKFLSATRMSLVKLSDRLDVQAEIEKIDKQLNQ